MKLTNKSTAVTTTVCIYLLQILTKQQEKEREGERGRERKTNSLMYA